MATERLAVEKLREILRQKLLLQKSHRAIGRSVGVSAGTVGGVVSRAKLVRLEWATIEQLRDEELDERLYGKRGVARADRPMPDLAQVHLELRRVGVTLQLLHLEYLEQHPTGYRYTAFCQLYRRWAARRNPVMRQTHKAGEKSFVDYSGKKPCIVDRETGEVTELELFVAVLGASNYTFAEATRTQQVQDFVGSHVRAVEDFGGVPSMFVSDQLKTGVTKSCRYEPLMQRSYREFARHYDTTLMPARPGRPRDKAKVEAAVLVAQRWILARLRNQTFFSLGELNERIAELCGELNDRPMRTYGVSRRELFERLDRPALQPLPSRRFVVGEWKKVRVNIDYHVEFDHHFYSVPSTLVHEQLEVRATATTVEIFFNRSVDGEGLTLHSRSYKRGRHTTKPEHMPQAHREHAQWSPSRLIDWGAKMGPSTAALMEAILRERRHPEHGYRTCLGILRLAKRYSSERLEAACARAYAVGARSYRHVESILKHGLERDPLDDAAASLPTTRVHVHENVRGADYYH